MTTFDVTIDLKNHARDALEALGFRQGLEDAIEEYGIGKVTGGGSLLAGTSVDVSFETENRDLAHAFLEDYLTHCGVFGDTKVETEPTM
jgi:hypothetical protein